MIDIPKYKMLRTRWRESYFWDQGALFFMIWPQVSSRKWSKDIPTPHKKLIVWSKAMLADHKQPLYRDDKKDKSLSPPQKRKNKNKYKIITYCY